MLVLNLVMALILLALSAIHVYWALGGRWGFEEALPTNGEGVRLLNPRPIDSAIVAFGLFLFGLYYLVAITTIPMHPWLLWLGQWLIPLIFLLRAVGDFRFVGMFKRVRNTVFARNDTRIFTPICLLLAAMGFLLLFIRG